MFASIRCYFVHKGPTDELVRLVEDEFADRIAAQPGFVSYAFLDCGGGGAMTISVFREAAQAAASRELAQRWSEERLGEIELTITEALHGAIPVSRAAPELVAPRPPGAPPRFARVRRYRIGEGDLGELVWRVVDTNLAERMAELDGFVAYLVFSGGAGELVTVSVFRDRATATASDELARQFVANALSDFEIKRADMVGGGEIVVSRVTNALLESPCTPEHLGVGYRQVVPRTRGEDLETDCRSESGEAPSSEPR